MSFVIYHVSINLISYYPFYFCVIILCFSYYFVCYVICIVSPHAYCCSLPFVYKCKDHFHWVENQVQSVNIILYHIISSAEIMPNITLWNTFLLFLWCSLKEVCIWFSIVCWGILQDSILKKSWSQCILPSPLSRVILLFKT